jgi:ATP adenylyltransferase
MSKAAKKKKVSSPKKISGSAIGLKLNGHIWPLERDVLFRPDRLKYVRKLVTPEGCVFCTAANNPKSVETLCLYKSEHSMVVLNKYPYNSGHVLILPRRHIGNLLELTQDEFSNLHETLKLCMQGLNEKYRPEGMNLGLNHGKVAGAGLPEHLHYHIVPRWSGDLNFFPLIADTKVVVENIDATYNRLAEFFDGQGSLK